MVAWREEVAALDAAWKEQRDEARIAYQRLPRKPVLPIRPKRPLKPKGPGGDLTVIQEVGEARINDLAEGGADREEIEPVDNENEELAEFMRELDLDRFEQLL